MRRVIVLTVMMLVALVIVFGVGCGDDPPVGPVNHPPQITSFTANSQSINPSDSVILSWQTSRTESLWLSPPDTSLPLLDLDTGSIVLYPESPTTYTLVASNAYGNDSAEVTVSVSSVPVAIVSLNGLYFKGTMEDSVTHLPMQFAVINDGGEYLLNQQIQITLLEGDGYLGPKSIGTDTSGVAESQYTFNGSLAYATIRLWVADVDTLDVFLRAGAMVPGAHGQAQYILLDDTYEQVVGFNGQPDSIDTFIGHSIMYVNYESTLGVVVMLYDLDMNRQVYDTSSVYGVILNTVYEGTTFDNPPIGVGSPLADLRAVWGDPSRIYYEGPRPAIVIGYDSLLATFYGHWETGYTDTLIEEIHFFEPVEVE